MVVLRSLVLSVPASACAKVNHGILKAERSFTSRSQMQGSSAKALSPPLKLLASRKQATPKLLPDQGRL